MSETREARPSRGVVNLPNQEMNGTNNAPTTCVSSNGDFNENNGFNTAPAKSSLFLPLTQPGGRAASVFLIVIFIIFAALTAAIPPPTPDDQSTNPAISVLNSGDTCKHTSFINLL